VWPVGAVSMTTKRPRPARPSRRRRGTPRSPRCTGCAGPPRAAPCRPRRGRRRRSRAPRRCSAGSRAPGSMRVTRSGTGSAAQLAAACSTCAAGSVVVSVTASAAPRELAGDARRDAGLADAALAHRHDDALARARASSSTSASRRSPAKPAGRRGGAVASASARPSARSADPDQPEREQRHVDARQRAQPGGIARAPRAARGHRHGDGVAASRAGTRRSRSAGRCRRRARAARRAVRSASVSDGAIGSRDEHERGLRGSRSARWTRRRAPAGREAGRAGRGRRCRRRCRR
jgi:hypothetical protein